MTFGTDTMHHYRFTCKTSTSLSTLLPLPFFIHLKEVATFSDIEGLRKTIFIQFNNNMYINCEIFQAMKLSTFSISDDEEFEKKNVILL